MYSSKRKWIISHSPLQPIKYLSKTSFVISRHTTVLQKENHTHVLRHSAWNIQGRQEWRLRETSTPNRSLFKWTVRLTLNYFPTLSENCHRSWTKSPLYIYRVLFFIIGRENVIKKKKKGFQIASKSTLD